MRRFFTIIIVFQAALLLTACNPESTNSALSSFPEESAEVSSSETTSSSSEVLNGTAEPMDFSEVNPYNDRTVMDEDYIYTLTYTGIYRAPKYETNLTFEQLIELEAGQRLAQHGNYLYYTELGKLYRVCKDGSDKIEIIVTSRDKKIEEPTFEIKCYEDTLYINLRDGVCAFDITNDPETLTCTYDPVTKKNASVSKGKFPMPDGYLYYLDDTKDYTIYKKNIKSEEATPIKLKTIAYKSEDLYLELEFLVTESNIIYVRKTLEGKFYHLSIRSTDLDGNNEKILCDLGKDELNYQIDLLKYDSGFLYFYLEAFTGSNRHVYKLDIENGVVTEFSQTISEKILPKNIVNLFDVEDGYLFVRTQDGEGLYTKENDTQNWMEIK